jgi:hypothetical protein
MSLARLGQKLNRSWPAIAKAENNGKATIERIRTAIQEAAATEGSIDSEDISVVVFGSLARLEWTSGSDLDWTLLIDGEADHEHAETGRRMTALLAEGKFIPPGRTETFGTLAFSHSLIHQIGGQDDTNRNTTQRMLLLLESTAINRAEAYERVIRGIVKRYLENDFRAFRLKVPRFLLNDVHRFWRTMCVDYASKYRERAAEGWAIRNVKLRMSRKLIFAAGLITCFSCDPEWVARRDPELARQPTVDGMVDYLVGFVHRTPLEIVGEVLLQHPNEEAARTLLDVYDCFLAKLDDKTVREHLQKLPPEGAATSTEFSNVQNDCRRFEKALEEIFFNEDERLGRLTREYGVF